MPSSLTQVCNLAYYHACGCPLHSDGRCKQWDSNVQISEDIEHAVAACLVNEYSCVVFHGTDSISQDGSGMLEYFVTIVFSCVYYYCYATVHLNTIVEGGTYKSII